jgi:hypothetical protein
MQGTKPILIGAIVLFLLLAGAGIYAFTRTSSTAVPQGGRAPAAIRLFAISGRTFSVSGDSLGRVEIWAVTRGQQKFLGNAVRTEPDKENIGATWTFPIPAGLKGATGVFARGYDASGVAAAKMDLPPVELKKI